MRVIKVNGKVDVCHPNELGHKLAAQEIYNYIENKFFKKIWNSKEAEIAREKVKNCPNLCVLPCFVE